MYDSRFRYWASGDTFVIYPGARSSVRFERLIDGIELSEKVRTLRAKYPQSKEALQPLEEQLALLKTLDINNPDYDWVSYLAELNNRLNDVSAKLAE